MRLRLDNVQNYLCHGSKLFAQNYQVLARLSTLVKACTHYSEPTPPQRPKISGHIAKLFWV